MINFVPKQETCIKLKEAGMPQDLPRVGQAKAGEGWYWIENLDGGAVYVKQRMYLNPWERIIARAPLTDELWKILKPILNPRVRLKMVASMCSNHPSESLAQLILELSKEGVLLWPDNQGR